MFRKSSANDMTRIAPQTSLEGKLTSPGDVVVHGKVSGEISISGKLTIEQGAKINARVAGGLVRVVGQIEGEVKAEERLEVAATGRICGLIKTPVLAVEPGAIVEGQISMTNKENAVYFPVWPVVAQTYARSQGGYVQKYNPTAPEE